MWLTLGPATPTRKGKDLARFLLPFVLLAAPHAALNLSRGINPLVGHSFTYLAQDIEGEHEAEVGTTLPQLIAQHGPRVVTHWAASATSFVLSNPFLLLAFVTMRHEATAPGRALLGLVVPLYAAGILAVVFSPRGLLLPCVLMVGYLAKALPSWLTLAKQRPAPAAPRGRAWRAARACLFGCFAALLAFRAIVAGAEVLHMLQVDEVSRTHREITETLYAAGYTGDPTTVLGCSNTFHDIRLQQRDRYVLYRDGLGAVTLPDELTDGPALVAFLKSTDARYVLYQPADRAGCPAMPFLLRPENLPASLQLLFFDDFYDFEPGLALYRFDTTGAAPPTR